jgi:hypothetical protein
MYLIQILLPLNDNQGKRLPFALHRDTMRELTRRFRGLTAYTRAPAEGVWKPRSGTKHDEIVVYEVMAPRLERKWWKAYRRALEKRFRQESVVVRAQELIII